ncbi:MAG: hypothetical protein JRD49_09785 [Deltaproteobacteria bacterium]|nr:hypothetical protein [Deltaproteobacteria bacterium]MBW2677848.1 hypothetical protein [Deltaproteobacteria bacterium]
MEHKPIPDNTDGTILPGGVSANRVLFILSASVGVAIIYAFLHNSLETVNRI